MIDEVFDAARLGDSQKLKDLLNANPALANMENADGLTPLGFAAHFGQAQAVGLLLDHGADANAVSHSKISYIPSNTALHAAIAGERSLDVIRLLLERGAATDIRDSNGHTCLHVAAYHGDRRDILDLLIEYEADINAITKDGTTALMIAKEQGNLNAAEWLRQRGAAE